MKFKDSYLISYLTWTIISVLTLPSISQASQNYNRLNAEETLNEISLEAEVEEFEVYDGLESAKQSAKAITEAKRRTLQLRNQISHFEAEKKHLRKQIKQLNKRYDKSAAIQARVEKKATKAERERDLLVEKVDRLNRQVEQLEQQAISAKNRYDSARKEIRQQAHRQQTLNTRKKEAKRSIGKYKSQLKTQQKINRRAKQEGQIKSKKVRHKKEKQAATRYTKTKRRTL